MKLILRFFSRSFLIRMSMFFRPLMRIYYGGNKFIDPIDGSGYRKFLAYGYGKTFRHNALCPGTLSLERHRLLWLYLERETYFLKQKLKVLHVAPEQVFYKKFKQFLHWDYTTTDLYSPLADVVADICDLPFQDHQYDLILCNHVLEHIPKDLKAMAELYRVLKKGGTLIAQVPMSEERPKTFQDDSITDPNERTKVFGQYDHVRIYGQDYYHRLESVGFSTERIFLQRHLTKEEIRRYGLPKKEKIPVMLKQK
ncbi:MAG: methyltransferase domain-containing protein [Bacteroidota bacterium]|nr:methyltransferase domain-containing protein [Bacteroidota bacterium]